jgi:hypothetical protein
MLDNDYKLSRIELIIREMIDDRFGGSMEGDESYDSYIEAAAQEILELLNNKP